MIKDPPDFLMEVLMSKRSNAYRASFPIIIAVLLLLLLAAFSVSASAVTTDGVSTNIPDSDIGGAVSGSDSTPQESGSGKESTSESDAHTDRESSITLPEKTEQKVTTLAQTTSMKNEYDGSGNGWIVAVIIIAVSAAAIIALVALTRKNKKD